MSRAAPLLLAGLLLAAGCGGKPAGGPQQAGGLTVDVQTDPKPAREGLDTNFVVTVRGANGPVSGAGVHVQLFYTSLGDQTGPAADAAEKAPGRYETGPLVTGKGGNWIAEVTLRPAQGSPATLKFPFAVAR
jgi:hypothetical protein